MKNYLKTLVCLLIASAWLSHLAFALDVVFIDRQKAPSAVHTKVEQACQFYGLQLESLLSPNGEVAEDLLSFLRKNRPDAVIVTAISLADASIGQAINGIRTLSEYRPSVLIAEVDSSTDQTLLRELSFGAIHECVGLNPLPQVGNYEVVGEKRITKQLMSQMYEANILAADVLKGVFDGRNQSIVQLSSLVKDSGYPIFAVSTDGAFETFFLTKFKAASSPSLLRPGIERGPILELLPFLMYLGYTFGERCWQSPGHFANLTIDDPWLREPYGHLRFRSLLADMEKANFHTTLAFVPWNYDRSDPDVVSLFSNHTDRFSICLHGNNHDHSEFSEKNPLEEQERDIIQGLARMEEFSRLTKVPYDRVMVFPHSIGNERSLQLLKKHHFLATVNGDNIPAGENRPLDILFYLRNYTLNYSNIASLKRADAEAVNEGNVALDLFLGNPILLYSHHDLFKKGTGEFNRQAGIINEIEPSVRWVNLGTIARNLFLKRKRQDGDYDVIAFCHNIEISNTQAHSTRFHVQKPEPPDSKIRDLLVDGASVPYDRSLGWIHVDLMVPERSTRTMNIIYEDSSDLRLVDISKKSRRISLLRRISDFRDITLSQSPVGRIIIGFYYDFGIYRWGGRRIALVFGAIFIVGGFLVWRFVRRYRRKRNRSKTKIQP